MLGQILCEVGIEIEDKVAQVKATWQDFADARRMWKDADSSQSLQQFKDLLQMEIASATSWLQSQLVTSKMEVSERQQVQVAVGQMGEIASAFEKQLKQ